MYNEYIFIENDWFAKEREWDKKVEKASRDELPSISKQKEFHPVNENLPILSDYPDDLPKEYWDKWEKREYAPKDGMSWIDPDKLVAEAIRLNVKEKAKLEVIREMLEKGADLGVEAEGRMPTNGRNQPSVKKYGARVADSLQTGIKDGIIFGPFDKSEVPWADYKVSPMTVRLKPNGSARIIMNLSWPHDEELGDGVPTSVNEGMKNSEEFEECKMTSDWYWRKALYRAGWPAEMCKSDWNSAYK